MRSDKIVDLFDRKFASVYDQQWSKLAPLNDALHLLMAAVLADLPRDARLLCVGAGTGAEIFALASRFPGWRFMAVDPSMAMLDICRRKAEEAGVSNRCEFHVGYLDSLPPSEPFDAATSILVSQFILAREARCGLFRAIADRLRPAGVLVSADLAADTSSAEYRALLEVWARVMLAGDVPAEGVEKMKSAYGRTVAVLPAVEVEAIIAESGFEPPVRFLQSGLIHAWFTRRAGR